MSTNARITLKKLSGERKSIYLHWDGYIEHAGLLLQLCYDTPEKIEKLLELGDISALYEHLEPTEEHSFDKPQQGVTIAYHRDRGEPLHFTDEPQEYNYTFDEEIGAWVVTEGRYTQITSRTVNATYNYSRHVTSFLIDKLVDMHDEFVDYWEDDEFATKDNLINVLLEKANTQVAIANQRRWEKEEAYYRAYYD